MFFDSSPDPNAFILSLLIPSWIWHLYLPTCWWNMTYGNNSCGYLYFPNTVALVQNYEVYKLTFFYMIFLFNWWMWNSTRKKRSHSDGDGETVHSQLYRSSSHTKIFGWVQILACQHLSQTTAKFIVGLLVTCILSIWVSELLCSQIHSCSNNWFSVKSKWNWRWPYR